MAPPSPILQDLQSNREGGFFSITPGLRDAERRQSTMAHHALRAAQSEQAVELQESYDKDSSAKTSDAQDLVEAMQGLTIFSGLRPGSRQFPLPPFEASVPLAKQHVNDTACTTFANTDAQVDRVSPRAPIKDDSRNHREALLPREVGDNDKIPLDKIEHDNEVTEYITEKGNASVALPEFPTEQDAPQVLFQLVEWPAKLTDSREDFEDLALDNLTPDSPASSIKSASSDDDFERVTAERHETRRNGQPSAWISWI
ncbi:uncharacterized protein N0V89_010085 [Didymosphaeria variabile]|uniref:Uncharacterized protein n=1 Tax=Didymosphaeria variabile TaxID=1932322 RepID=A0A9W8XF31_9PLEO|nr:uncharacterized protein N0V89_010085 [Didymosphaeria variabile]KAJ4348707.1 hypothetical protein N0V89_010085 [Didymosphaeria variabile]